MALLLADIVNSMIQAIIFSYTIEYCIRGKKQIRRLKLIVMTIIIFIINSGFTSIFGNLSVCVFIIHIACLIVIGLLYKNNSFEALMPYTLVYCFILITAIIFSNLFFGVLKELVSADYAQIAQILTIYVPQILLSYLCIKYIDKFTQLYKVIVIEPVNMITLMIISFGLDFVVTYFLIIYNDEDNMFINIITTILCMFLAFVISHFIRIKSESNQIFKLNKFLESKNNELRKIKHDYGEQISYLYDLCLMERFDDIKKLLKGVINTNGSDSTPITVTKYENSLLSVALKPALDQGIHVIMEDNCDFKLINMNELELFRIVSNIVNNAIKALNGKGIIIAKSYEYLGNVIIKIENNGPKIPEHNLNDIFKSGFTTKENSDKNHGFGLSIANDLVRKSNGRIHVKSDDESTEFKIVLPKSR